MIDTKELRTVLARHGTSVLNEDEILELLDRLESAESDALEQARMNGMGASREAALMAKLEAAEKEAAHIKEIEFPRKVRAVAAGWETMCARLEQERDNANAAAAGIALQAETLQAERDDLLARIERSGIGSARALAGLDSRAWASRPIPA